MKYNPRCSICTHPQRHDIVADRFHHHLSLEQIRAKYFPDRKTTAVRRAIREHFKKHQNVDEEARAATTLALATPENQQVTVTASEEWVFVAAVRERIEAARALEAMLSTLMQRANLLQEEWQRCLEGPRKCEKCGRRGELVDFLREEKNLSRIIQVFKEIREQLSELLKVKNPMSVIEKMAERTFLAFVRGMTDVYMKIIMERNKVATDAVNKYLAGESDAATLAAAINSLQDHGASQIAAEAENLYNRIMQTMLKELRR